MDHVDGHPVHDFFQDLFLEKAWEGTGEGCIGKRNEKYPAQDPYFVMGAPDKKGPPFKIPISYGYHRSCFSVSPAQTVTGMG